MEINLRMVFVSVGFTAFLGVFFSPPFGLSSSYPVCLRPSFIPCTTKILLQVFPILMIDSAFRVLVFCPRHSLIHVCVLNGVTFLFCYSDYFTH